MWGETSKVNPVAEIGEDSNMYLSGNNLHS